MKILEWKEPQSKAIVGAMYQVATEKGRLPLSDMDREMLVCTLDHIFDLGTDHNLASLPSAAPNELAKVVTDDKHRRQAIHFLSYMPYTVLGNEETTKDEMSTRAKVVLEYADALGIDGDEVRYSKRLRDKKIQTLRLDFARYLMSDYVPGKGAFAKFKSVLKIMKEMKGDPTIARPFQKLGLMEKGTLGRSVWEFYRQRDFPLPGEPGCLPEDLVFIHDLSHILSGNNTDPYGELATVAFQTGYTQGHPFEAMMDALFAFQFNLILEFGGPQQLATANQLDPHAMMLGIRRGSECTRDFLDGTWNYREDFEVQVEELRERYGIHGANNDHETPPEYPRGKDNVHTSDCP